MPRKIHLVFKTHLDIGFTSSAADVIQNYFTRYFPAAMKAARELRESGRSERFIWTTGSWLIYEYLERATPAMRREMEAAILAGDLAWHALPFTTHTELMDVELFRSGLSLSQHLDRRFGRHTIAAKMSDVPGHTRGIIPLLTEAGVQFLHIGVNDASSVPCLPPLFRWQDPAGAEIIMMVESGYGRAFAVEGIDDTLAFSHTNDNIGPQTASQVIHAFHEMQEAHPDDQVFASTLNAFAAALEPIRKNLPVVTQEIGDTWIHGIGSDPVKVSQFRELLRLRSEWLEKDPGLPSDARYHQFQRRLLLVPEHTWGMDEKTFLADHQNYAARDFAAARSQQNFQIFASSWAEKRAYIQSALDALGESPLASEAHTRLASIRPARPNLRQWQPLQLDDQPIHLPQFNVQFDPSSGALIGLTTRANQHTWADAAHPLGLLRYQTFSAADYERFFQQYIRPQEQNNGWSREDFTKPGLESAAPVSRFWQPEVMGQYWQQGDGETRFLFHLTGEPQSVSDYGCPQNFFLQVAFPAAQPEIHIELQWFNKPATRLPEAIWFKFQPLVPPSAEWLLEKLGQQVSPLDVIANGNRHLHAVGRGITCKDQAAALEIVTLDAPLLAPDEPAMLNFNNDQPDLSAGVHFNLYNNLWGTNFPMWLEDDCKFRFVLKFQG